MPGKRPIAQSKVVFISLLVVDMLNTILQETITLSKGDRVASARAAIIVFVLCIIILFGPLTIGHYVYLCIARKNPVSFITSLLEIMGVLFFFYGNNITSIINNWRIELGCDSQCVLDNQIAAAFSLGMSLIIFQIVPSVLKKLLKLLKRKQQHVKKTRSPDWYTALDLITMFIKINTIYSAIVGMTQSTDFCSSTEVAASSVFLSICVLLGFASELIDYFYALDTNLKSNKEYIDKSFNQLVTIGMILIVTICLPFYLLADNFQPLDCAFSCDTIVANATISTTTCNQTTNSGVRLGFTLTTLIIVLIFSGVYFYHVRLAEINRKKLKSNIVIITGKETVV
ncbi:uncharacterized protein LOC135346419 [Halichondria panicea]|uniref:uncharacterized protein LOC135346419 n=1 Tax=Halichondria panicea TaxID=6063 RepID=UPI00312B5387